MPRSKERVKYKSASRPMSAREIDLIHRSQAGDSQAQGDLVAMHEGAIRNQATKTLLKFPRAEMEDVLQAGRMALLEAAQRYEWDRGCKFISYAFWWLRNMMDRTAHVDRLIQFPMRSKKRDVSCVGRAMSVRSLTDLVNPEYYEARTPRGNDGGPPPDDEIMREMGQEEAVSVRAMLDDLLPSDRDWIVVEMTLCGGSTLAQCGQVLHLTKERVRQLRNRALERLRDSLGSEWVEDPSCR